MKALIILVLVTIWTKNANTESKSRRKIVIPGDLMIGALLPVHEKPEVKYDNVTISERQCGRIRDQYGIQRVEAMLFALDKINQNGTNGKNMLNGIKLGLEIRDECWDTSIALEETIDIIKDTISGANGNPHNVMANGVCDSAHKNELNIDNKILAVIGAGGSSVSINVQNLLQLFDIPHIGYSATVADLSNKKMYKTFLRVVPSDYLQVRSMIDFVLEMKWTYIFGIYTDGSYGQAGMDAFRNEINQLKLNVCLAAYEKIKLDAKPNDIDGLVIKLNKTTSARVIVCFCYGETVRELFIAIKKLNLTGRFLILGSDGWSDRDDVAKDYYEQALGSFSVKPYAPHVKEFDGYFLAFNFTNNERNIWFKEYWTEYHNCTIPGYGENGKFNDTSKNSCSNLNHTLHGYHQDPKMSYVMNSLLAIAHGVKRCQEELCHGEFGLCERMRGKLNGSLLLKYIKEANFTGITGEQIYFDENGDPPGRYMIMNIQKDENSFEGHAYKHVYTWDNVNKLNRTFIMPIFPNNSSIFNSSCSVECGEGEVKRMKPDIGVKCCWFCKKCAAYQYKFNEIECKDCKYGEWPSQNLTTCEKLPERYLLWNESASLFALFVSFVGLVINTFVMHIFIKFSNTSVVKSTTRELSYIVLAGIYLCYLTTVPLVIKPSVVSCYLSRIFPGLSLSVVYGALITKTNRISRIMSRSKKLMFKKKLRFMSITSQMLITAMIILVECVILIGSFINEPEWSNQSEWANMTYSKTNKPPTLQCFYSSLSVMGPIGYDLVLVALCTLYAIKTRNLPEIFNEAKYIGFSMYTTCVIWTAFVPLYFYSDFKVKVITLCLSTSFSATVILIFLFMPKVYKIIFNPEKNQRSAFTTSTSIRCHFGSVLNNVNEPDRKDSKTRVLLENKFGDKIRSMAFIKRINNINVSFDSFDLSQTFDKACQTEPQLLSSCLDNELRRRRIAADEQARLLTKRKAFKLHSLANMQINKDDNNSKDSRSDHLRLQLIQVSESLLPIIMESNEGSEENKKTRCPTSNRNQNLDNCTLD